MRYWQIRQEVLLAQSREQIKAFFAQFSLRMYKTIAPLVLGHDGDLSGGCLLDLLLTI